MQILFWISALSLIYIYVGYPALLYLLVRAKNSAPSKAVSGEELSAPACSVVISSFNDANSLKAKIESVLAQEPTQCVLEVLVASDGSTDQTKKMLESFEDERVRPYIFEQRRGKLSALNTMIPEAKADLIVLTDSRQPLEPHSIPSMLARFADEQVGVVSGNLVFRSVGESGSAGEGMNVYWRYEKFIRNLEGQLASVPGATGAFYAIRKDLFKPVPSKLLLDDVAIPMQAVFQKKRCVFEPEAVAYDTPSSSAEKESVRKRRTLAGNIQLLRLYPKLLIPGVNPIWFQYMSHKVGRLFSPFILIICFLSCLALLDFSLYWFFLALQVVFYIAALVGYILQEFGRRSRVAGAALMFVALNVSTLLAWGDALRGRFEVTWDRSDKEED